MNINILNDIIKKIADQIPLINSYYTDSPYESWNVREIKYGSISFVITGVSTRESITTYNATLYYADRLLEDKSNRDAIYSDAATVIQTIVGALNQADELLTVEYPVGITLFEQDFADSLAGGYANITIDTEGMGECFEDDFTIPEIIATSAYFTKEQIAELFPMKNDLATIAFSGSFNDLKDTPNLATVEIVNGLAEAVVQSTCSLAAELNQKVNIAYFDGWADGIEAELSERVTRQDYNNLVEATENVTGNLAKEVEKKFDGLYDAVKTVTGSIGSELDKKVDDAYFDDWKKNIETEITNRPTTQSFDTLRNDIIDQIDTVRNDLDNKVGSAYFENWKDEIEAAIEDAPSGQEFNKVINDVNDIKTDLETRPTRQDFNNLTEAVIDSTSSIAEELNQKVSTSYFDPWADNVDAQLENRVKKQDFDNFYEAVETVTGNLATEIEKRLTSAYFESWVIENDIKNKISKEQFDELYEAVKDTTGNLAAQIKAKLDTTIFDTFKNQVNKALNEKTSLQDFNNLTEAVIDSTTFLTAALDAKLDDSYFNEWADGIEAELSERVTRQAFDNFRENIYDKEEIDTLLAPYLTKLIEFLNSDEAKETIIEYVKPIVAEYLSTALDYYTKAEMDEILANLRLEDYYNKEEIDSKLANLDLTEYYTKEETYNKTEIDVKLENLHLDDYYTKTEIDDKFTVIDNILNNVLYKY